MRMFENDFSEKQGHIIQDNWDIQSYFCVANGPWRTLEAYIMIRRKQWLADRKIMLTNKTKAFSVFTFQTSSNTWYTFIYLCWIQLLGNAWNFKNCVLLQIRKIFSKRFSLSVLVNKKNTPKAELDSVSIRLSLYPIDSAKLCTFILFNVSIKPTCQFSSATGVIGSSGKWIHHKNRKLRFTNQSIWTSNARLKIKKKN